MAPDLPGTPLFSLSGHSTRVRVGVYAFAMQGDTVLACQLSRGPHRGLWTLPGGGMDAGEQPLETLHREIHEETGLVAEGEPELWFARSVSGDQPESWMSVQLVYRVQLSGEPTVIEVDGSTGVSAWMPAEALQDGRSVSLVEAVLDRWESEQGSK